MKHYLLLILFVVKLFAQNEEVVLQLQWKHQFQFAGFYVAKEMGFYDVVGLYVIIKEYAQSTNVID